MYSVYECPKCFIEFRDKTPNNIPDTKKSYDNFMKCGTNGQPNYVKFGIPKEQVTHLLDMYNNLKDADDKCKQEAATRKESAKGIVLIVTQELAKMRAAKELILKQGPKFGEG